MVYIKKVMIQYTVINSNKNNGIIYVTNIIYVEIYNEKIYILSAPGSYSS